MSEFKNINGYWLGKNRDYQTKQKIRNTLKQLFKEGKLISPMKNKKHTEKTKKKMSESAKNIYNVGNVHGFQKGNKFNLNKKMSKETILKIKQAKKGFKHSEISIQKISKTWFKKGQTNGSNNSNWKGGISPINQKIRTSDNFKQWRKIIFKRDDYICQECLNRSGNGHAVKLHAHHIKTFSKYPLLRFDLNNGITLCKPCHDGTINQEEEFEEYFLNKLKNQINKEDYPSKELIA